MKISGGRSSANLLMTRGLFGMLFGFLVLAPLAQTGFADQITMKNGDHISGQIIKKDGATLTVKSDNFGTLTLKWDDIVTLKTDQPINVVLSGNRNYKTNVQLQDGQIQLAAPAPTAPQPASEVVTLRDDAEQKAYERFLHPGILDLWNISGSLNLAGTAGNAETSTFTTPFNFVRDSNTSKTTAYFNSITATAKVNGVNSQTANAIRGGWAYSRNLTKKVFFNAFNDNDHDKFESLALRIAAGGGMGYSFWSAEHHQFSVVAGGDWDRDAFAASSGAAAFTRTSGEAYWGDDFLYRLGSRTDLTESFRMFNNLSYTGQYRMNFDTSIITRLTKWLNWNISLSDRYLSDPVPGFKTNDFLYSSGLGISFAR